MQHARLYCPRRVGMEEGKESARSCNAPSISAVIGANGERDALSGLFLLEYRLQRPG